MRMQAQATTSRTGRRAAVGLSGPTTGRGVLLLVWLGALVVLAVGLIAGLGQQRVAAEADHAEPGVPLTVDTWHVDWEATGANDGSSWTDAFIDLQLALNEAGVGDEIWVAAGTYYPSVEHGGTGDRFKSFQMLNGVAIFGGFDPSVGDIGWEDRDWIHNKVFLSGDLGEPGTYTDNSYHVFNHLADQGLDSTAILNGFFITRGNADDSEGLESDGGGMRNVSASPTVANCVFEYNRSYDNGAGMANLSSAPTIRNCTFRLNRAGWEGGGLYNDLSSPVVEHAAFSANSASFVGGGVSNHDSSPSFRDCTFVENEAEYGGGGMMNWGGVPALTDCSFVGNLAISYWGEGGGMQNSGSSAILTNCTFALNQAIKGGGIYTWGSSPKVTNCTFFGNVADEGGALSSAPDASPVVANSILWADTPDETSGGSPIIMYSDVQGGHPGEGNIDQDPQFVDAANGDYHLALGSPCIDTGTNYAPHLPPHDFEGDERVMDGDEDGLFYVDMGIDEVLGPTLVPITGLQATNDSPTPLGGITTLTATIATGNGVSYDWDLGDYSYATGSEVTHAYWTGGEITAVVTATNLISHQSAETVVTIVASKVYLPLVLKSQ